MYKNQLQELAQRSCFNLPSYACVREGPDHAPRFKASVNFNGEIFQGPSQCTTLRQAEHAAAEVALTNLSSRAPSRSLAARVLDETGVYKNLLQETTHRAGLKLPIYTTVRSGPGHQPIFSSAVELAGMCIAGEPAKTKKQAEKNAAMAAWSALKQMPNLEPLPRPKADSEGGGGGGGEDQDQLVRYLSNFKPKEENKQTIQTEHYQQQLQKQRRKAVGCFNEGTSSPVSANRSSRFQQQWRTLDPLPDFPLMNPPQQLKKKSSFLAPALSTGPQAAPQFQEHFSSKEKLSNSIFHPKSISIVGTSLPQARAAEFPPLLEGKLLERVNEMASVQRFVDPSSSVFASRAFSPPPGLNIPIEAAPPRNCSSFPVPRIVSTGGFRGRGIAPAVQIRSVIPVCAAPPIRQPQPLSSSRPPPMPKKETVDDISAATSKITKLQL